MVKTKKGITLKKNKNNNNNKNKAMAKIPKSVSVQNKYSQLLRGGLDAHAVKYLELLGDPCNGDLVMPPYEGEGTGLMFRTKNIVTPTAVGNNVSDSFIQFTPQYIIQNAQFGPGQQFAPDSRASVSPIMFGGCVTTGGTIAAIYSDPVASSLFGYSYYSNTSYQGLTGSFGAARCVAACIKVKYTGSELNRQGQVWATLGPTNIAASVNYAGEALELGKTISSFPQSDRLGERVHEYLWVPGFDDQKWISTFQDTPYTLSTSTSVPIESGNSLIVAVQNAYAGSIVYEVNCVWEVNVTPAQRSGLVASQKVPETRNTLNDILRTVGNIGRWALGPEARDIYTTGSKFVSTAVGAMSRVAMLAL